MSLSAPVAGLEIGTTRTVIAIGEMADDGRLAITALGSIPSSGVRKSQIIEMTQARYSIESVLKRLEEQFGYTIGHACLAVSGPQIRTTSMNTQWQLERGFVHEDDIAEINARAEETNLPPERTQLELYPIAYGLDELGAIVMLHIPRDGRLRDPVNLEQILEIKELFPNVRLIIAHIGRAYVKEDVGNAFTDYLNRAPDLMYDFTANCCEYAITEVIRNAGPEHVMYGTDMPILRMRTHRIEENGTYINLVPPGLYGDPAQDRHLREVSPAEAEKITFFVYEELLAFKRACETLGCTREDVSSMMYGNAKKLIDGARRSIYGE